MIFSTEARVATATAKKYAAQIGKHWQHNMEVTFDGDAVAIRFPRDARGADWPADALVTLTPEADAPVCRIDASDPAQRDGLKSAVERHVDRFAFREGELTYDWRDA